MKYLYLIVLFCCISACSSRTLFQSTPFVEDDVHPRIAYTETQVRALPPIPLYRPALYYTRPNSILFITHTADDFIDDFAESDVASTQRYDIFSKYNKSVYHFNSVLYQVVFAPFIKSYLFITPKPIRVGIRNILSNALAPLRCVLNILMGNFRNAGVEFSKFIVNTTAGGFGFIDITEKDTPRTYMKVTLDDVFASWGIPSGPFVVIPIIGGRTLRGAIALPIESVMNPVQYILPFLQISYTLSSIRIISSGAEYWDLFYMIEKTSVDAYVAQREMFWQYMEAREEKMRKYGLM